MLRHLYTMSRGSSSQYIINCLHRDLISSSENSASSSLPILTSDLSSPNLLSCPFSFSGLVLEYGGQNLCQFLDKNAISLSFHSRYQILKEIISAVQFLHYHHIVHLNLKPENIVSFASPKEGISRWKLVDFEISCDLSLNPSILLAHSDKFLFSPEYTAPELIKLMNGRLSDSSLAHM